MACIFVFLHINRVNNPDGKTLLQRLASLDLLGTAIFIPAIVCLLLALQWGGAEYPWNDQRIIGLFVGFGAMILIFIGIQLWKGDRGTLPPKLFRNRNVLAAMLFAMFFGASFFSLIYYICTCILTFGLWIMPGYAPGQPPGVECGTESRAKDEADCVQPSTSKPFRASQPSKPASRSSPFYWRSF